MNITCEQESNPILRLVSRSCTLLFIFGALCGMTRAQSQDPANPTPITSQIVEGKANEGGATYYYRFKAKQGSVTVTLKGRTNNYSTQFEADLVNTAGVDLGDIYVSAGDTAASASKTFTFDSPQSVTIVVKLLPDEHVQLQQYRIVLSGAVDFGGQGGGSKNSPSPGLPDLKVVDVKISGPGGNTATVYVQNVCSAYVIPSHIRVKMTIFKGANKASGPDLYTYTVLEPWPTTPKDTGSKGVLALTSLSKIKSYTGRYIRVDVDPDNTVAETIETNNWWETGAAPFPDPSNHCSPKSP
jgi:hypothetical protein